MLRALLIAAAVFGMGAVHTVSASESSESKAASPCPNVPDTKEPWKLITTPQVEFCVPVSWSCNLTATPMKCRGKSGFITFGAGMPPMIHLPVVAGVVGLPEGMPDRPDLAALCSRADSHEEEIGDTIAYVHDMVCIGMHYTSAIWSDRQFWFQGECQRRPTVELQFSVYRTVRFPKSDE